MKQIVQYSTLVLLFLCAYSRVYSQPVQEIKSNFEEYFKGDDRDNLKAIKGYLEDKEQERQATQRDLDDVKSRMALQAVDTSEVSIVENSIKAMLKANGGKEIYRPSELTHEIVGMARKYGFGGLHSANIQDTALQYNLGDLLLRLQSIENNYKSNVSTYLVLTKNLKNITSDIQNAEVLAQNIFTIEKGNQSFKTRVSICFSGIIVILLGLFFWFISTKSDKGLANEFLSGNGIQFVALFALIIAIVLFGILGILEGRELAAILSGISGFILGKGITGKPPSADHGPRAAPHAPGNTSTTTTTLPHTSLGTPSID